MNRPLALLDTETMKKIPDSCLDSSRGTVSSTEGTLYEETNRSLGAAVCAPDRPVRHDAVLQVKRQAPRRYFAIGKGTGPERTYDRQWRQSHDGLQHHPAGQDGRRQQHRQGTFIFYPGQT